MDARHEWATARSTPVAVKAHLDDPDLSAERLADLLHVSYNNLFKKQKP